MEVMGMPKQAAMPKIRIERIQFTQLKSLRDVTISFEKPLTAIMGVNGCGKTTILHALACVFQPVESGGKNFGENYKFSYFFTPNSDTTWSNSKLSITYTDNNKKGSVSPQRKEYHKDLDRWSPKYTNRPRRPVYYIGIDSCTPEIEMMNSSVKVSYTTSELSDGINTKVCEKAAYILNKEYRVITENDLVSKRKKLAGVKLTNGLQYSALSMGTGEQRVIRILQTVFRAPAYSMILIDEIDLLMHVVALKKLVCVSFEIARDHNLQIVFTTHSLAMHELCDYIDIRYLDQTPEKTIVYSAISNDFIRELAGEDKKPISVFVEDIMSKYIILEIAKELHIRDKLKVSMFGSISNAFTLAAGIVLKDGPDQNTLIVLDGDEHRSEEEKIVQIKKHLSGTEGNIESRRQQALSMIVQYNLPNNFHPEQFIHSLLLSSNQTENEIVSIAKSIHAVNERHKWISWIVDRMNEGNGCYKDIIEIAKTGDGWEGYVGDVKQRLQECISRL